MLSQPDILTSHIQHGVNMLMRLDAMCMGASHLVFDLLILMHGAVQTRQANAKKQIGTCWHCSKALQIVHPIACLLAAVAAVITQRPHGNIFTNE